MFKSQSMFKIGLPDNNKLIFSNDHININVLNNTINQKTIYIFKFYPKLNNLFHTCILYLHTHACFVIVEFEICLFNEAYNLVECNMRSRSIGLDLDFMCHRRNQSTKKVFLNICIYIRKSYTICDLRCLISARIVEYALPSVLRVYR